MVDDDMAKMVKYLQKEICALQHKEAAICQRFETAEQISNPGSTGYDAVVQTTLLLSSR